MFLTFFCFTFLFFLLVGACKSYFVALVLLSLHFVVNKVSNHSDENLSNCPDRLYSPNERQKLQYLLQRINQIFFKN